MGLILILVPLTTADKAGSLLVTCCRFATTWIKKRMDPSSRSVLKIKRGCSPAGGASLFLYQTARLKAGMKAIHSMNKKTSEFQSYGDACRYGVTSYGVDECQLQSWFRMQVQVQDAGAGPGVRSWVLDAGAGPGVRS